jgi:VWFA-related protein
MMENLPYRKSVVFISGGLPLVYYSKIDRDIRRTMLRLTDACNRASVVIYSIEAERLKMLPQYNAGFESIILPRGGSVRTPNDGRYHLAQETGGVYFQSHNSPDIATHRILQDQQGYYLLAYTPESPSPQTVNRRIDKIKVKVNKQGLQVRARSAAFGK